MASSLPTTPTETPDTPELTRVPAARVPDNQPLANKTPTDRRSQIISNMRSNPSNSRYTLETRAIAPIDSLVHYKSNAVINPITGTAE